MAPMKQFTGRPWMGMAFAALSLAAIAGWAMFFRANAGRLAWREQAQSESAITSQLRAKLEDQKGRAWTDSSLTAATDKLSDLMIRIQTRTRELAAIDAEYQARRSGASSNKQAVSDGVTDFRSGR
jgi:hypothetical protein